VVSVNTLYRMIQADQLPAIKICDRRKYVVPAGAVDVVVARVLGQAPPPTVAVVREPAPPAAGTDGQPLVLSVPAAARLLRVARATLERAYLAGQFPVVCFGSRVTVPTRAIEEMEAAALASGGLVYAADCVFRGAGRDRGGGVMRRLCGPAEMRRHTPLRRVPLERRPASVVPGEVRRVLAVRSGGVCEVSLPVCRGQATDVHHRVRRGAGGRHGAARVASDSVANLLHVCRSCHEWVHANPALARDSGWLLGLGLGVPELAVVSYRGEWRLVDDLGGVHVVEAVGA
jgi:hypothetical protein